MPMAPCKGVHYWYQDTGWKNFQLAPPGSASLNGGIAACASMPYLKQIWWIGQDGSVQQGSSLEGAPWEV